MLNILSDEQEIISALNRVDWNFPRAMTLQNTVHSLHWFPGNFIPQIPSYLVQLLSKVNDLVLDPFCGSGTTGIEALSLGRRIWQTDANRASILITHGKLAAITCPHVQDTLGQIRQEFFWNLSSQYHSSGQNGEGSNPELNRWFHQDTLAQLRFVWHIIESVSNQETESVLKMLFSDTLFACASTGQAITVTGGKRKHHWGWIADNVLPKNLIWHDAIKLFRDRLEHACYVISSSKSSSPNKSTLLREDIRSLSVPDSSVDLVVTSPPYLGMIDYALSNRLTYLWFGWPLTEDQDLEIGARRRRNRHNAIEEYLQAITVSCEQIMRALRPQGFCAIVIGASRKYPHMADSVIEVFARYLRLVWGPIKRVPTRRRVSERRGTEPFEAVCIFQK